MAGCPSGGGDTIGDGSTTGGGGDTYDGKDIGSFAYDKIHSLNSYFHVWTLPTNDNIGGGFVKQNQWGDAYLTGSGSESQHAVRMVFRFSTANLFDANHIGNEISPASISAIVYISY